MGITTLTAIFWGSCLIDYKENNVNSSECKKCEGCKHITNNVIGFCYMFVKPPEVLPCGQHDKYLLQRQATGRAIAKNPMLILGMIQGTGK